MTLMSRVREHTYTVVENEAVGDGIWRMVFRAPKLAGSLEPGQFMNFHVPGAKQINLVFDVVVPAGYKDVKTLEQDICAEAKRIDPCYNCVIHFDVDYYHV